MDLELRNKALAFATKYHEGQKRKDGKDYITHPIAVAQLSIDTYNGVLDKFVKLEVKDTSYYEEFLDELYVLSLLHDVVEDTAATIEDVRRAFGNYIASSVAFLTRQEGQTYYDFIMRLVKEHDFLPIYVKLGDLKHNMSDLNEGSLKDKYRFAHLILMDTIEEAVSTNIFNLY